MIVETLLLKALAVILPSLLIAMTVEASSLARLEGYLVKLVFNDGTPQHSVIRGRIISVTENCATIETRQNVLIIDLSTILKVQTLNNDPGGHHDG